MSGHSTPERFAVTMEGRRRWSRAEKLAIVAEIGDGPVSPVARKHNISASLLFRWRRDLDTGAREGASAKPGFVPLALPAPKSTARSPTAEAAGSIEIVLANNCRIIVGKDFDGAALKRVIEALEAR
jgi:transposase-like protein